VPTHEAAALLDLLEELPLEVAEIGEQERLLNSRGMLVRWLAATEPPCSRLDNAVGLGRHKVHAVTLRLDIILDGRTPPGEPAGAKPAAPPAPQGR
jgi:hypothetical protein